MCVIGKGQIAKAKEKREKYTLDFVIVKLMTHETLNFTTLQEN